MTEKQAEKFSNKDKEITDRLREITTQVREIVQLARTNRDAAAELFETLQAKCRQLHAQLLQDFAEIGGIDNAPKGRELMYLLDSVVCGDCFKPEAMPSQAEIRALFEHSSSAGEVARNIDTAESYKIAHWSIFSSEGQERGISALLELAQKKDPQGFYDSLRKILAALGLMESPKQ